VADAAIQFCEKCGRDRETFPTGSEVMRVCPRCTSACCPDCWNLVAGACLACVPFSLPTETPHRIVIAPEAIAPAAATIPTPDAAEPLPGNRPGRPRRVLRFAVGVAASGVIVVGVSFATVAATWRHAPAVAVELPSPAPTPTASRTAEPTATPTATPARRTAAPATPHPVGSRPTDHPVTTASKTPTPPPIIHPPATPKPTPVATPPPTPEPAPDTPTP